MASARRAAVRRTCHRHWRRVELRAAAHGCAVHAYDPTVELRERHEASARALRRVRFHYAGLHGGASKDANAARLSFNGYGRLASATLMTLDRLLHEGRAPARVLTIDCEGCEWAAFEFLATNASAAAVLRDVEMLNLEVHVSPAMLPPTLSQFVSLFDFLLVQLGFRLWEMRANRGYPDDQVVVDWLGVGGLNAGVCCYELALTRRTHHVAPTR